LHWQFRLNDDPVCAIGIYLNDRNANPKPYKRRAKGEAFPGKIHAPAPLPTSERPMNY